MRMKIDDENLNDLQRASIHKLIETAKGAHITDIHMRLHGKDVVVEADWLKHIEVMSY